jgi:hypothetical protein
MTLRTRGKINFRIPTKEGSEEGLVGTAEGIELTTEFKMNKKKALIFSTKIISIGIFFSLELVRFFGEISGIKLRKLLFHCSFCVLPDLLVFVSPKLYPFPSLPACYPPDTTQLFALYFSKPCPFKLFLEF